MSEATHAPVSGRYLSNHYRVLDGRLQTRFFIDRNSEGRLMDYIEVGHSAWDWWAPFVVEKPRPGQMAML